MKEVEVNVEELLEVLKANRDAHSEMFEKAWTGFSRKMVEVLEKNLEHARLGMPERVKVYLETPKDHSDDYDRAIAMLEMTRRAGNEKVTISVAQYAQLVDDDWGWKDQFLHTNSAYIS
jgi:hypothetical protein